MIDETSAAAAALSRFRATLYLLLSGTFSQEMDRDALSGVDKISEALVEATDLMEISVDPDFQTGKVLLRTFFRQIRDGNDDEQVIRDLSKGYASLFLGVGPTTVSPCESVYRSGSGLLCQSTHFEVQQAYREIGMAKNEQFHEPDDHVAVELSYMAKLCELTQESIGGDRGKPVHYLMLQRSFLESHLLSWIPEFSRQLLEATNSPFYQAMAHLLNGYIKVDNQLIRMMIRELDLQKNPQ